MGGQSGGRCCQQLGQKTGDEVIEGWQRFKEGVSLRQDHQISEKFRGVTVQSGSRDAVLHGIGKPI